MWNAGVRDFVGIGNSLVYHFGCKSTGRVKKNKGKKTFLLKWGITAHTFTEKYLKRGAELSAKVEEEKLPKPNSISQLIKRIFACFGNKN
jgi:hypothetical protein